jgi:hypothetical protein
VKILGRSILALALALGLAVVTTAGEAVTLTGDIVCALCILHKPDTKECQNVLVVKGKDAGEYYMTKNAVYDELGMVCTKKLPARVTGKVSEKGGKKWITASKIEKLEGRKGKS